MFCIDAFKSSYHLINNLRGWYAIHVQVMPPWLAKNVCNNVFNRLCCLSGALNEAEVFRKASYCGSPIGTALSKALGATIRTATHYNDSVYIVPQLGCQLKGA